MGAAITGWGIALPKNELTSAELARRFDVSEEWILERTGIKTRPMAAEDESSATLATDAGAEALGRAGIDPADLDLVMIATCTPDYQLPATASLVQTALGAEGAGAFDVGAACAGFLYGLAQAGALVEAGVARRVLLCGAEALSRVTDYSDLRSCVLFGDGAGAVVVEQVHGASNIGPFSLHSDGSLAELLFIPPETGVIKMQGREVYRHAVEGMTRSVNDTLSAAGVSADDVDLLVAHQANSRILDAVASRLGFSPDRAITNIDRVGNTSAASIPIAIADAVESGALRDGDAVVLTAFGSGFAWGAGLIRWGSAAVDEESRLVAAGQTTP